MELCKEDKCLAFASLPLHAGSTPSFVLHGGGWILPVSSVWVDARPPDFDPPSKPYLSRSRVLIGMDECTRCWSRKTNSTTSEQHNEFRHIQATTLQSIHNAQFKSRNHSDCHGSISCKKGLFRSKALGFNRLHDKILQRREHECTTLLQYHTFQLLLLCAKEALKDEKDFSMGCRSQTG